MPPELDVLIGSVLHRLRTPLTAIKGWTELAHRDAREEDSAANLLPYLARTRRAVTEMQEAIDTIAAEGRARLRSRPAGHKLLEAKHTARREDVVPPSEATAQVLRHGHFA